MLKRSVRRMLSAAAAAAVLCGSISVLPMPAAAANAEETFCSRVRAAWESGSTSVSMRNLSLSLADASRLYYGMLYTESKWFYVSSSFSYGMGDSGYLNAFQIKYNCDTKQIAQRSEALSARIAELEGNLQDGWTDAEKLLYFHDWLSTHCSYDMTYTNGDAYSALVTGSAVCQGYALAMNLLAREAGIPCYSIVSDEIKRLPYLFDMMQANGLKSIARPCDIFRFPDHLHPIILAIIPSYLHKMEIEQRKLVC